MNHQVNVFNQYNAFNLRSDNREYVHLNFAFVFQNALLFISLVNVCFIIFFGIKDKLDYCRKWLYISASGVYVSLWVNPKNYQVEWEN